MSAIGTSLGAWWTGLTLREQIMLGLAAGLVIILLGMVLIVRPLTAAHDRARDDYAASMRLYRSVEAHAETVQRLAAEQPVSAAPTQSLRAVVGSLALQHDLALARMVPGEDGRLTVNLDNADTTAVLAWLVALEQRHGIQLGASTLDREADGFVSASFVLSRGGQ